MPLIEFHRSVTHKAPIRNTFHYAKGVKGREDTQEDRLLCRNGKWFTWNTVSLYLNITLNLPDELKFYLWI